MRGERSIRGSGRGRTAGRGRHLGTAPGRQRVMSENAESNNGIPKEAAVATLNRGMGGSGPPSHRTFPRPVDDSDLSARMAGDGGGGAFHRYQGDARRGERSRRRRGRQRPCRISVTTSPPSMSCGYGPRVTNRRQRFWRGSARSRRAAVARWSDGAAGVRRAELDARWEGRLRPLHAGPCL